MANTLKCDIVIPDKMLFSGEATLVSAPAGEGDIGMMYQCSPLMSTLRLGIVRVKDEQDEVRSFAVDNGYLEVDGQKAVILATRAIDLEEVSKDIADERIAEDRARLAEMEEDDPGRAFLEEGIAWQEYLLEHLP